MRNWAYAFFAMNSVLTVRESSLRMKKLREMKCRDFHRKIMVLPMEKVLGLHEGKTKTSKKVTLLDLQKNAPATKNKKTSGNRRT